VGLVEILSGKTGQSQYHLTKHVSLIGAQDDAVITLTGWFAPKTAAMISRRGDGYVVSQTESGKRILVNGRPIQGEHKLRNGDVVEVAGITMRFLMREIRSSAA
jgi:NMD protein affecting ribosome stability and mRNA decay